MFFTYFCIIYSTIIVTTSTFDIIDHAAYLIYPEVMTPPMPLSTYIKGYIIIYTLSFYV